MVGLSVALVVHLYPAPTPKCARYLKIRLKEDVISLICLPKRFDWRGEIEIRSEVVFNLGPASRGKPTPGMAEAELTFYSGL